MLSQLYPPYRPNETTPIVEFHYAPLSDRFAYEDPTGTGTDDGTPYPWWRRNINVVNHKITRSGWESDGAAQHIYFSYDNANQYFHGRDDAFQGFTTVTRCWQTACGSEAYRETTDFLTRAFDAPDRTLNGKTQRTTTAFDAFGVSRTVSIVENSWEILDDPTATNAMMQPVMRRTTTTNPNSGVTQRSDYAFDHFGNRTEVREFGEQSVPQRTSRTDFLANTSAADGSGAVWLVNLAWRNRTWAGLPAGTPLSKTLSHYDSMICNPSAVLPTTGLLLRVEQYAADRPDNGVNSCGSDWLATNYSYDNANGNWQLVSVTEPQGLQRLTHWTDHAQVGSSETVADGISYVTTYTYNDPQSPWLTTAKTAPNGAVSGYAYDRYGRVTYTYPPHQATGAMMTDAPDLQVVYHDDWAPMAVDRIQYPTDPIHNKTSRRFYDAIGRKIQERAWSQSNHNLTFVDSEYDALGRLYCQSAPQQSSNVLFENTACTAIDHTLTRLSPLGSPAHTTNYEGAHHYGAMIGHELIAVDGHGYYDVRVNDDLGRMIRIEEREVTHEPLASGTFAGAGWGFNGISDTGYTLDGTAAVRLQATSDWQAIARRTTATVGAGEGVTFRVRFGSASSYSGRLALDHAGADGYLGFGLNGNQIMPNYNLENGSGGQWVTDQALPIVADEWYRGMITIAADGTTSWRLWIESTPEFSAEFTLIDPFFTAHDFRFLVQASTDEIVYLGDYQEANVNQTAYAYDLRDNLTSVTDAHGNTQTLTFNSASEPIAQDDPDLGFRTYAYDAAGNLVRQTDANDQRICTQYDQLGRIVSRYHSGSGTAACPSTPSGTLLAQHGYYTSGLALGWLQQSSTPLVVDTFSYDYRGRTTTSTRSVDGDSFTQGVVYDLLNRPIEITYPDGEIVTPAYDAEGVDRLIADGQTLVDAVDFDGFGRMVQIERGNGVDSLYSYADAAGGFRLDQSNTAGVLSFDYDFDVTGLLVGMQAAYGGESAETTAYRYDSLNRLIAVDNVSNAYDRAYTYDAIGNVATLADSPLYHYGSAKPHAVTAIGADTFAYDANGNMIARNQGGVAFTQQFDAANRLVAVSSSAGSTHFAYDAQGVRVISAEYDADGGLISRKVTPFANYEIEERRVSGTSSVYAGGFEGEGWREYRPAQLPATAIDYNTAPHSGSGAAAMSNHANGAAKSTALAVTGGRTYTLRLAARGGISASASSGTWAMDVAFYDRSGVEIAVPPTAPRLAALSTAWQTFETTVIAPRSATTARVVLSLHDSSGWVAFDNVSLTGDKSATNLLSDGGFELGSGWTAEADPDFPATSIWRGSYGTAAPLGGGHALAISNHAFAELRSDLIAISAETNYTLAAFVRGELATDASLDGWRIRAEYFDASGSRIGTQDAAADLPGSLTTTWTQRSGIVTPPAGATHLRIVLINAFNTGWVAFDELSLVQTGTVANLVANGGFELGEANWHENGMLADFPATSLWHGRGNIANEYAGVHAYALSNLSNGRLESEAFSVVGGERYDVSGYVRGESSAVGHGYDWLVRMRFYDAAGALIITEEVARDEAGGIDGSWRQVSRSVTAPADAVTAQIWLYSYFADGWVAFDDVVVSAENATETLVRKTYSLGSDTVAVRVSGETGGLYYLHRDRLGSASALTDQSGALVTESVAKYYPFGGYRSQPATNPSVHDFGFTGHRHSDQVGLVYMQARFYLPEIGRFASADTLIPDMQNPQTLNRYSYVNNDPLNWIDPSGHAAEDADEMNNGSGTPPTTEPAEEATPEAESTPRGWWTNPEGRVCISHVGCFDPHAPMPAEDSDNFYVDYLQWTWERMVYNALIGDPHGVVEAHSAELIGALIIGWRPSGAWGAWEGTKGIAQMLTYNVLEQTVFESVLDGLSNFGDESRSRAEANVPDAPISNIIGQKKYRERINNFEIAMEPILDGGGYFDLEMLYTELAAGTLAEDIVTIIFAWPD